MEDQVKNLGQKDIDAKFIQDSFDNTAEDTKVKITSGNYSIILISPELLLRDTSWVYIYIYISQYSNKWRSHWFSNSNKACCIRKWHIVTKYN